MRALARSAGLGNVAPTVRAAFNTCPIFLPVNRCEHGGGNESGANFNTRIMRSGLALAPAAQAVGTIESLGKK
jgi:hypothetical protein